MKTGVEMPKHTRFLLTNRVFCFDVSLIGRYLGGFYRQILLNGHALGRGRGDSIE